MFGWWNRERPRRLVHVVGPAAGGSRAWVAVVVEPVRAIDLDVGRAWTTWAADRPRRRARCRVATVDRLETGRDERGWPITLIDGSPLVADRVESARDLATNRVWLDLRPAPTGRGPHLRSGDRRLVARVEDRVVRLDVATLADLPDFRAGLASLRPASILDLAPDRPESGEWMPDFPDGPDAWRPPPHVLDYAEAFAEAIRSPPPSYSDRLAEAAEATPIGPGDILPIAVADDGPRGVLELLDGIDRREFRARLVLAGPSRPTSVPRGTRLARSVRWSDPDRWREVIEQIATVV